MSSITFGFVCDSVHLQGNDRGVHAQTVDIKTYSLVSKDLWLRKQSSPSGYALRLRLFTAINP